MAEKSPFLWIHFSLKVLILQFKNAIPHDYLESFCPTHTDFSFFKLLGPLSCCSSYSMRFQMFN